MGSTAPGGSQARGGLGGKRAVGSPGRFMGAGGLERTARRGKGAGLEHWEGGRFLRGPAGRRVTTPFGSRSLWLIHKPSGTQWALKPACLAKNRQALHAAPFEPCHRMQRRGPGGLCFSRGRKNLSSPPASNYSFEEGPHSFLGAEWRTTGGSTEGGRLTSRK